MDVRRQARLTAGVVQGSSISAAAVFSSIPSLVSQANGSLLGPVPVPTFLPAYSSPLAQLPAQGGKEAVPYNAPPRGLPGSHRFAGERRQGDDETQTGRKGEGKLLPVRTGLGVVEGGVKKDRRKDRHKRASDGRNPMIRLNPSTADRFFAVQRLLESKRMKKTSGSFVINWLIDVAHASIQAVVEQGVGAEQQDQAGKGAEKGEQQSTGLGQELKPTGQSQQLRQANGAQDPRLPAHQSSEVPEFSNALEHSFHSHHGGDDESGAHLHARPADDEEELLVTSPTPHAVSAVPGYAPGTVTGPIDLSQYAELARPGQPPVRYTAAQIARTALASAEAAEAQQTMEPDDEDEEVDVVADDGDDGPYGGVAMLQMQAFGVAGQGSVGWLSEDRGPMVQIHHDPEDEEEV